MLQPFCTSNANKDTMNKHEQGSSVNDRLSPCSSRSEAHRVGRFFHTFTKRMKKPNLPTLHSSAYRIFQTGGGGGQQLIILTSFPQNCVKIKKNWTKKGCIAGAPLINYGQPLFKKLLTMKGRWPHKMVTNGTRHSAKRWMEWPQIRAFTVVHLYITAVPSLWFLPNRANHIRFKVQTRLWLTILLEGHFPLRQKT